MALEKKPDTTALNELVTRNALEGFDNARYQNLHAEPRTKPKDIPTFNDAKNETGVPDESRVEATAIAQ
jgi:hypothetical protein